MSSRRAHHDNQTSLRQLDEVARATSTQVLKHYSTSFGVATRLLSRTMRHHTEALYAMVRVADEIVDTYRGDDAAEILDRFEAEVHAAMKRGYSPDLVIHAFANSARAVGITERQTAPFFASMRMDLTVTEHTEESFQRYIYGSAGVVGEMCLAVFLNSDCEPQPLPDDIAAGARALGHAYQKINFLRDLATDDLELGRHYFPGVTAESLDNPTLARLVADARDDITQARGSLPSLPRNARIAVYASIDIYDKLLARIGATDATQLRHTRVRVANPVKLAIALRHALHLQRK